MRIRPRRHVYSFLIVIGIFLILSTDRVAPEKRDSVPPAVLFSYGFYSPISELAMPLEKQCTVCGKTIQVKPCKLERTKYCSKDCAKIGWKGQRRSRSTEMQMGSTPTNKLSIGTITIRTGRNGTRRRWIKVSEPNVWIFYAVYIWTNINGEIPNGFVLHHIDKNPMHDLLANLELLTRAEHINKHRNELEMAKKRCHQEPSLF